MDVTRKILLHLGILHFQRRFALSTRACMVLESQHFRAGNGCVCINSRDTDYAQMIPECSKSSSDMCRIDAFPSRSIFFSCFGRNTFPRTSPRGHCTCVRKGYFVGEEKKRTSLDCNFLGASNILLEIRPRQSKQFKVCIHQTFPFYSFLSFFSKRRGSLCSIRPRL